MLLFVIFISLDLDALVVDGVDMLVQCSGQFGTQSL